MALHEAAQSILRAWGWSGEEIEHLGNLRDSGDIEPSYPTKDRPECRNGKHIWNEGSRVVCGPCNCPDAKKVLSNRQKSKYAELVDIYGELTYGSLDKDEHNKDAMMFLSMLMETIDKGEAPPRACLFLYGPFRTGKTTTAVALAQHALQAGFDADVVLCQELAHTFSAAAGHGEASEEARAKIDALMATDILVIDDLTWAIKVHDAGKKDVLYTFEESFWALLDRYRGLLVLTGNFGQKTKKRESDGKPIYDLHAALGERVWERLLGRAQGVHMGGPGREVAKRNAKRREEGGEDGQ